MRRAVLTAATVLALLASAQPASAQSRQSGISDVAAMFYPVAPNATPPGFTIDGAQALAVAETSPEMQRIHRAHHPLQYSVLAWPGVHYEIEFSFHNKLVAAQVVTIYGRLG